MTSPDERSTKERLAEELERIGQRMLARRAREGEFDDFGSPHPFPQTALINALAVRGGRACRELAARVKAGEFDATKAEGDAWAASPEGQQALKDLAEGR